ELDRGIAVHRQELVEPMIIAEPDANDDGGTLEPREVRWPRLESFGVGGRRDDGLNLRHVAGHRPCQRGKIAGCGDDTQALRGRGEGRQNARYDRGNSDARHPASAPRIGILAVITAWQRIRSWAANSGPTCRFRQPAGRCGSPWRCWQAHRRRAATAVVCPATD